MDLVEGVHHVTFLTEDIERLSAFYRRVFEAKATLDLTEEAYATSSSRSVRRPSSIRSRSWQGRRCRPRPGRCSSAAGQTTSRSRLRPRRRFASFAAGSSRKARPTEMSATWKPCGSRGSHDPDGFYVEVIWRKPDMPDSKTLPRAEWKTVELS